MENDQVPSTSGINNQINRRQRSRRNRSSSSRRRNSSRNRPNSRRARSRRQRIFITPRPRSLSREQCQRIATPSKEEIQVAEECAICLDKLSVTQNNRKLICNHVFHEVCLFEWVQGAIGDCPVCRRRLADSY